MQLLRDNLTLWSQENMEEKDGEGEWNLLYICFFLKVK